MVGRGAFLLARSSGTGFEATHKPRDELSGKYILGFALLVGVIISIFQAVTQIQEMTLTFVPKILAVMIALLAFGPWIIRILLNFTTQLFLNLPTYMKM